MEKERKAKQQQLKLKIANTPPSKSNQSSSTKSKKIVENWKGSFLSEQPFINNSHKVQNPNPKYPKSKYCCENDQYLSWEKGFSENANH